MTLQIAFIRVISITLLIYILYESYCKVDLFKFIFSTFANIYIRATQNEYSDIY